MIDKNSGYESTYNSITGMLAGLNLAEAAVRLGFPPPEDDGIHAEFLGREYIINSEGVKAADGQYSHPNDRSILVFYIASGGAGEPEYNYCSPGHFVTGALGGGGLEWMTESVRRKLGDGLDCISGALDRLGAEYVGQRNSGHIWRYSILPKIPMEVIYYEADEDFPSELKLMLDTGTGRFFEFEQIAFLCGCFISALAGTR